MELVTHPLFMYRFITSETKMVSKTYLRYLCWLNYLNLRETWFVVGMLTCYKYL